MNEGSVFSIISVFMISMIISVFGVAGIIVINFSRALVPSVAIRGVSMREELGHL